MFVQRRGVPGYVLTATRVYPREWRADGISSCASIVFRYPAQDSEARANSSSIPAHEPRFLQPAPKRFAGKSTRNLRVSAVLPSAAGGTNCAMEDVFSFR
jgi:hypothetical protein